MKNYKYTWERLPTETVKMIVDEGEYDFPYGFFDTMQDCISDAKKKCDKPLDDGATQDVVTIMKCTSDIQISEYVNPIDILASIENDIVNKYGSLTKNWFTFKLNDMKGNPSQEFEDLRDEITECIERYLKKIGQYPNFYKVIEYVKELPVLYL